MRWLVEMLLEILHWLDYWHIKWGLKENLTPHSPGFLNASLRLYEYQRRYRWR